jgi:UTP--glucose-1-phosphate uridylyltransferase
MKKLSWVIVCLFINNMLCNEKIFKVIVPMAGLGTRLLPLTKAGSKSMVALIDKPALHHVVEEALQSNITDFCFIINENEKNLIERYFSFDSELDAILAAKNKSYFLDGLNYLLERTRFTCIAQPEPLGLGHAVLMGEPFIEPGEFFCVMLPDNIIESNDPHMAQLIAIAQHYNATVITVEEISRAQASQYAVVTPAEFLTEDLVVVADIVEKPKSSDTTFCLGQIGRHVFSYDVFEALKVIEPGVGGEIQLTDAVRHMIKAGKRVLAYKLHGKRHDVGTIQGLLETTVTLALHNPLYRDVVYNIFVNETRS